MIHLRITLNAKIRSSRRVDVLVHSLKPPPEHAAKRLAIHFYNLVAAESSDEGWALNPEWGREQDEHEVESFTLPPPDWSPTYKITADGALHPLREEVMQEDAPTAEEEIPPETEFFKTTYAVTVVSRGRPSDSVLVADLVEMRDAGDARLGIQKVTQEPLTKAETISELAGWGLEPSHLGIEEEEV